MTTRDEGHNERATSDAVWTVVVADPRETEELAARLGGLVEPGAVLVLDGDLGAGKTTFVRGLARGLGLPKGVVSSPTFTLIHEYEGDVPLYHFDAYRLDDAEEFVHLGAEEYLSGDGVCAIEWGSRVQAELPAERLDIVLQADAEDADKRCIAFAAFGPRPRAWLAALRSEREPDA